MRSAIAGNLAAHPYIAEPVLDGALERVRQLADGDFGRVACAKIGLGHGRIMPNRRDGGQKRASARLTASGNPSMAGALLVLRRLREIVVGPEAPKAQGENEHGCD